LNAGNGGFVTLPAAGVSGNGGFVTVSANVAAAAGVPALDESCEVLPPPPLVNPCHRPSNYKDTKP
jgi:hypothetical protein